MAGEGGCGGEQGRAGRALSHCAAEVREHDPERYLATLFAPAAAREALFALYAFDHEIARVRRVVSEPSLRLQWWRDALDALAADRPPAHPVIEAMHEHRERFAPLRPRLEIALRAREHELSAEPPADLAALERHLADTAGEVSLGAMDLLGVAGEPARGAARHLGVALGLVRLLQGMPGDMRRGRAPWPEALLARHGVDLERPGDLAAGEALRPAVADLAGRARAHLDEARRHRRAIPRRALAALLPAPLLDQFLARIARAGFDPLAPVRTQPGGSAPLRLLGLYALRRY